MLYYSYTLMFSLVLQHCCYSIVCHFVRSCDGVCLSGNKRITYLLNYLLTHLGIDNDWPADCLLLN